MAEASVPRSSPLAVPTSATRRILLDPEASTHSMPNLQHVASSPKLSASPRFMQERLSHHVSLTKDPSVASRNEEEEGSRLVRVCVSSADNLARKSMLRMPDPFALVSIDNEQFQSAVARRTLSPQWLTERDMFMNPSSILTIYVFDAKRYRPRDWAGFLGMAVIEANAFLDSTTLGEGATKVLNFRLRKRVPDDLVTGTICVKVRILSDELDMHASTGLVPAVPRTSSPRSVAVPQEEERMLSTSPGVGWQKLPKNSSTDHLNVSQPLLPSQVSTHASLISCSKECAPSWLSVPSRVIDSARSSTGPLTAAIPYPCIPPPQPPPPTVTIDEVTRSFVVDWTDDQAVDGVTYNLAVLPDMAETPQDIYSGTDSFHTPVGLVPGKRVRFVVSATNFFGTSEYSLPSPPITIPEFDETRAPTPDDRPHCPFFMTGFCPRGSACPLYHGERLSQGDLAAALAAIASVSDPDVQLAFALQASMQEAQGASYDDSNQTLFKREFHRKELELRERVGLLILGLQV
ncbi:uncharacterized protein MONBRDRAFT_12859 [Monosiga brevicollis MX1]|uniref:C3H1-type domain-containing protein n=1 Tax=Monosiga brevicollis TaxID=81824 RepID=A9VDJ1_MONBE|nr:uncharacterized protein MONBRDRAFT_12859 [Monosiga brevicollis MX1]EDQ84377.1 predicted protein [Monosiga brevicollis MX1]|eukprot:XP_001750778.1 hypothetical protein [Monosiga brevicollis MX1]